MNSILSALISGMIVSASIAAIVWFVMQFAFTRIWNAATRYAVWWATLVVTRFLQAVFVFHPVVHWIARRIDLEREMACDDVVVQVTGRPAPYASCLTRVVELAGGVSASTLAASAAEPASDLERRVEMLLDNTRNTGTRLLKLRLSAAVAVLGLMVWTASGVPDFIVLAAPLAEKPGPSAEPIPAVVSPPPAPARIEARGVSRPESSRTAPQQPQRASREEATRPDAVSVTVPVVVRDSLNRYVSGLEIEHFKVFEDGIEQDISQFVASTNELSVAVVLDMRDSNASNQIARQTAEGLLRNSQPEFELSLISALSSGPAGLLEGVRMGLTKLAAASNRRKVVLIISEGNDRFSPDMTDQVAMLAGSPDVPIYAISLAQLYPGQLNEAGALSSAALLDVITEQSGGRHFAIADQRDLPDILTKLSVEWRNGYLLDYQPRNTSRDGQYRQIRVELLPPRGIQRLNAMIRPGYFASAQQR